MVWAPNVAVVYGYVTEAKNVLLFIETSKFVGAVTVILSGNPDKSDPVNVKDCEVEGPVPV